MAPKERPPANPLIHSGPVHQDQRRRAASENPAAAGFGFSTRGVRHLQGYEPAQAKKIERILIVDDDAAIRRPTRGILKGTGRFDVIEEAASGEEALVKLREAKVNGAPFDLVITDYDYKVIGGFNGITLWEAAKAENLAQAAILLSGTEAIVKGETGRGLFNAVFLKPFRIKLILDKITELDQKAEKPSEEGLQQAKIRVLYVDSGQDPRMPNMLLESYGFSVTSTDRQNEAIGHIEENKYDVLVIAREFFPSPEEEKKIRGIEESSAARENGDALARMARAVGAKKIILITNFPEKVPDEIRKLVDEVVQKPFDANVLADLIKKIAKE